MLELDEIGVFRICAGRDLSIEESSESLNLVSELTMGDTLVHNPMRVISSLCVRFRSPNAHSVSGSGLQTVPSQFKLYIVGQICTRLRKDHQSKSQEPNPWPLPLPTWTTTHRDDFPTQGAPRGRRSPSLVTGCGKRTWGATWDTVPAPVLMPPLRRHWSPGRTGCTTLMRLQPESSQAGPNDDLGQTAWYRPSAATGLEGAT
ncbi:hypothetical protein PCASD_24432 [Puccinia coronata f. sp. avenae]|uniref:Uncharacterized protein n=1 Tax=Puccinia coronata f. sp. avenae TaxID=200324 RepID=A0A2N5S4Q4_9BASI|nr:hypothetical protein PCASD_24432 [Puccinia coronata f. sp. avenae]